MSNDLAVSCSYFNFKQLEVFEQEFSQAKEKFEQGERTSIPIWLINFFRARKTAPQAFLFSNPIHIRSKLSLTHFEHDVNFLREVDRISRKILFELNEKGASSTCLCTDGVAGPKYILDYPRIILELVIPHIKDVTHAPLFFLMEHYIQYSGDTISNLVMKVRQKEPLILDSVVIR